MSAAAPVTAWAVPAPALGLRLASAFVASHRNPYSRDEELMGYQRDLLAPFGVEFREDLLQAGSNINFVELAEHVLRGAPAAVPHPDMVIVTYGLPDCQPLKTVSSHLDYLLGGGCRSFAVSEQGLGAPFTALRIASAYAASGRCERLALFVLEQTTFPYADPLGRDTASLADSAALLVFDVGGGWEISGLAWSDGELTSLLTAAAGAGLPRSTLVVAGPWTDPRAAGRHGRSVHRVVAGSYCTSVWLDLARHHENWAREHDAIILADTDPRTGRSHCAVLRLAPAARALRKERHDQH
ncbi:MAG TPA: hypothetical protein VGI31_12265 [Streptosporangiaceae bacterium]